MRLPVRLNEQHPLRKAIAAILIAAIATILAMTATWTPGVSTAMEGLDNTFYDAFYHFRTPEDRTGGDIVLVAVDDGSLEKLCGPPKNLPYPLPRTLWAKAVPYVADLGAKAIVFDLTFESSQNYDREFANALNGLEERKIPYVMASMIDANGKPARFSPPTAKPPVFGAVNILNDKVVRDYLPVVHGVPSLAVRTVEAVKAPVPAWANAPFRLHYYGPNEWQDKGQKRRTYTFFPAWQLFSAESDRKIAAARGITPELFKNKIVIFCTTAAATYDLKSSPLSPQYPGAELHATAIDNMLANQVVSRIGLGPAAGLAMLASVLAAIGVVLPRRVWLKISAAVVALTLLVGSAIVLFRAPHISWLPMAAPLLALLIATVGAFAWSYLTEDRQRRLVFKALGQYVSPKVAAEIQLNPDALKLGGQRRDMTVMFTDIQGFTDLSESMESEKLSEMLNYYLGEMSGLILANNGTLDKYIGDAIMSFWNAPALQPNHAELACRAALAMRDREAAIQPQLTKLGAPGLVTRIGINTGAMIFGNMGAPQKFNYSVLGDSVNLGSRLEGANKFYGSRILVAESTAKEVRDLFLFRQLDVIRVKGKDKPVAVFELLAQGAGDAELRARVTLYAQAFALYQAQKWEPAEAALQELLMGFPQDLPAKALQKRVEKFRHDPPAPPWDGVYVARDK